MTAHYCGSAQLFIFCLSVIFVDAKNSIAGAARWPQLIINRITLAHEKSIRTLLCSAIWSLVFNLHNSTTMSLKYIGWAKSFSIHHIFGTVQDKTQFYYNVEKWHWNTNSDVIFTQWWNIFCKLARYYYTNQMSFPTVHFLCWNQKRQMSNNATAHYSLL